MSGASRQLTLLLLFSCCVVAREVHAGEQCTAAGRQAEYYTAAVFEHRPFLSPDPLALISRQQALRLISRNLDIYEQQVAAAARKARGALGHKPNLAPGTTRQAVI